MFKKKALKAALKLWNKGSYDVQFWDGEVVHFGDDDVPSKFKIIFNAEPRISDIKSDVIMTLGEAYMHRIIDFEGSMNDIIDTMFKNQDHTPKEEFHFDKLLADYHNEDQQTEKQNIHSHYDLGNDFFALWLDKTMSYSCAYFEHPDDTLEQAQLNKIDHTLRKLNLQPGEKLLDIGCGWGWLIIRAAQKYKVHATGITLSKEQYDGVRKRIADLGLTDLVDVRFQNYLDMDEKQDQFDKIVSVGMFEHVGKKYLPLYLAKVNRLLKDGGSFLLHSIMGDYESPSNPWMAQYIFPGGYIPSLRETVHLFPEFDFNVIHMESLRRHYCKTLQCWYENFKKVEPQVKEKYGDEFTRMWGLYLQGCAAAFWTGHIDVYQTLLTKGTNNDIPWTNAYMYKDELENKEDK